MSATEPELVEIKTGWAAVGTFWAEFGKTKDEAVLKYEQAKIKYEEISKRIINTKITSSD